MMAGISGKNTKPELLIRKTLHARGFRFRLHSPKVPGRPDLILSRYHAAIFVHGCFWHFHGCHLVKIPSTRKAFWQTKLERNRQRDEDVRKLLLAAGWRLLVIWECALKGKYRHDIDQMLDHVAIWIRGEETEGVIAGRPA